LWLGEKRMPDRYRDYADRWRSFGYQVIDWTEDTLHDIINRDVWDAIAGGVNVGGGLPETGVAVQRADLASYELLAIHGGIYANCDIEPLRDLHGALAGVACFGVIEQWHYLSNALMGCTPGHAFFKAVVEQLPVRYFNMPGAAMNEQTGPHLLTAAAEQFPEQITILEPRPFFPYTYGGMEMEGRVEGDWWVEHHWGHKHPELVEG
jgi:mannosyltransferase OCH1-like enzyme